MQSMKLLWYHKNQPQMCMAELIADDEPTTHELKIKASVAAWEDVRPSFMHVVN